MMVVGVLTLIVSARGSVELGGLGSAVVGVGSACFGPLLGAAADRFGQRPTLLITAVVNSASLGALAWAAYSPLSIWAVFAAAFLVGASGPQTSPMSRSRLVTIIATQLPPERRPRTVSTVLAYESAADEVVFVFGPVIVGVLATAFGAWAPIAGAAVLTLFFVTAFALHRTGAPARSASERAAVLAPAAELRRPRLLVIVFGILTVGLVFGTTLTSLTAFMQDRGSPESAGLLYGIMGVGSAILAICVALFSPRFTLRYRWLLFAGFIVAGEVVLSAARDLGGVALGLAITGIGIGPLLVTLYSFGAQRSPEGRSATVMTMLGSGITLGQSAAAAITGLVAEQAGTAPAMLLPACAGALALAAGVANWFLTPPGRDRGRSRTVG
ncbi:MFS transporter [Leucobacter sp. CSA1]|uniref:MFS transporter n=2 Tax=Leucobacter chromiisoli TaxID=2796471 RepID=A0A934UUY5_9MICO|nr:MFS transporter [Leucobacter chromiisoli]